MRPFPSSKLTWFVCRVCNRVRAYTASDLLEIPGRIPMCTSCDDGAERFMQRIEFEIDPSIATDVGHLTAQLDYANKTVANYMELTNELEGCVDALHTDVANRDKQLDRISTILREDES